MNRLAERAQKIRSRCKMDTAAEWKRLLKDWASLNGIRLSAPFSLDTLYQAKCQDGGVEMLRGRFPARDHCSCFKRNRRSAAIVTEPYPSLDISKLRALLAELGLVMHMPPDPFASFWFPGATVFIAITRPDFGPVRWLPDQLDYDSGNDRDAFGHKRYREDCDRLLATVH